MTSERNVTNDFENNFTVHKKALILFQRKQKNKDMFQYKNVSDNFWKLRKKEKYEGYDHDKG